MDDGDVDVVVVIVVVVDVDVVRRSRTQFWPSLLM